MINANKTSEEYQITTDKYRVEATINYSSTPDRNDAVEIILREGESSHIEAMLDFDFNSVGQHQLKELIEAMQKVLDLYQNKL